MSLPNLLPFSQAAKELGIPEDDLRTQIEAGTILAGILPNGEIVVSMSNGSNLATEKRIPKEELPEYKKHAHLKGQGIGIGEAARQYNIKQQTISKWVKADYIRTLGQDGQKILVDEADVAYCSEIYLKSHGKRGKWLFNADGTPYKSKFD